MSLTASPDAPISDVSRSPRASPETSQSRSGMRRPAGWLVTTPSGGSGNLLSATTSGRHKRVHARLRRAMELADGEAPSMLHPTQDRRPKNRRGGAPRGGHPRRADCASGPARDARRDVSRLRACVTGPRRVPRKHPSACQRSASLVRARGQVAKLGGDLPRENDDARPVWNKSENGFIAFPFPRHIP
jgi:hypothetical protein